MWGARRFRHSATGIGAILLPVSADAATKRREAAVLVPVLRRGDEETRIVVVRRGERGIHGGQIAFPGGKRDAADASLEETALREAAEETGLVREAVEIVERLTPVDTLTTRFRIVPFLSRVDPPPAEWRPRPGEIAEVLEVAVADLARPGARGERVMEFPTWPGPRRIRFFRIGEHRLWGATYRILEPLLPRLLAGEV